MTMKAACLPALGKRVKPKPRSPVELVQQTRSLLLSLDHSSSNTKCGDKVSKLIRELKVVLYGDSETEPSEEACAQLTREFFREDTLHVLIVFLPKLSLEARKDVTQVVANLQRQPVRSRPHAAKYLETNLDLMDHLLSGYEDSSLALHYGGMLRECIRHLSVAQHFGYSTHEEVFHYIQFPNFEVAADATETFKFFPEFNLKLLESTNYITRRQAIKLLGCILLDRANSKVMMRYVSSKDNLMILMNLLRESSTNIQTDAFHVFTLFVANENKPPDIVAILITNRNKLLRLFAGFKTDSEDELLEADKEQVVELEPKA